MLWNVEEKEKRPFSSFVLECKRVILKVGWERERVVVDFDYNVIREPKLQNERLQLR
jgi:hypothetical protein